MPKDRFLAANPKIAEAYAKDPAFHDGFDSMEWAKKQGPASTKLPRPSSTSGTAVSAVQRHVPVVAR